MPPPSSRTTTYFSLTHGWYEVVLGQRRGRGYESAGGDHAANFVDHAGILGGAQDVGELYLQGFLFQGSFYQNAVSREETFS